MHLATLHDCMPIYLRCRCHSIASNPDSNGPVGCPLRRWITLRLFRLRFTLNKHQRMPLTHARKDTEQSLILGKTSSPKAIWAQCRRSHPVPVSHSHACMLRCDRTAECGFCTMGVQDRMPTLARKVAVVNF